MSRRAVAACAAGLWLQAAPADLAHWFGKFVGKCESTFFPGCLRSFPLAVGGLLQKQENGSFV